MSIYMTEFTNRYANTNYVVARSTSHNLETKKVASHDIMCQWSLNLQNCLKDFPLESAKHLDCQGRPQLASLLTMTKGFEVLDGVKADLSI